jgi:predicted PurR-regulated permease PerM
LLAEPGGEIANVLRLAALGATHVERVADQKQADRSIARELCQTPQVFANRSPFESWKPLRRDPQSIADSQADAAFSNIQRQYPPDAVTFHIITVTQRFLVPCYSSVKGFYVAVFSPPAPTVRTYGAGLFLTGLGAMIALLYYGRAFCITLVISVILAFLLEPFVVLVMRLRIPRGPSAFIVCTVALLGLYLAGFTIFTQLADFFDELPYYSQRVNQLVDNVAERVQRVEGDLYKLVVPRRFREEPAVVTGEQPTPAKRRRRNDPPPPPVVQPVQEVRIKQDPPSLFQAVYGYLSPLYNVVLMASFVPFLVFFMLSWRDHLRKRFLSMFEGDDRAVAGKTWQSIANMARAYVVGNFILGILLSIASALCFWSWALPYWPLVGVVSGFLSLVPYVGLPLALIPAVAATLMTYNNITPFLVIGAQVAFFHLMALNLLYPAIVGARVHLNPLAVTIALMFWGTIWGGVGLVLAIPITAGMKAVMDSIDGLQPYGRLLGD